MPNVKEGFVYKLRTVYFEFTDFINLTKYPYITKFIVMDDGKGKARNFEIFFIHSRNIMYVFNCYVYSNELFATYV